MNSYKIDVRALTEQQKKDVQEAFFRLGYRWEYGGKLIKNEDLPHNFYYVRSNGLLTYGEFLNTFKNKPFISIRYTELMTLAYGGNTMNKFTKADLKDGMVVKQRGGNYFADKHQGLNLILNNHLVQSDEYDVLSSFNEDLTYSDDDRGYFDIVEVYNVVEVKGSLELIYEWELECIWKREEQTQQQKQLVELKTAQEELLLKAKEIGDKIVALQQGN